MSWDCRGTHGFLTPWLGCPVLSVQNHRLTESFTSEKTSRTIEALPQLGEKRETVAVWELKENPGLQVRLGRLKAAQKMSLQPSPFKASSPQTHIHDPSLCFASWQLQRGRRKVGGRGEWKTNCSYTWGPGALQVFQMEKKSFSTANW